MFKTNAELKSERDWGVRMDKSRGIDGWSNYGGPDYSGWIVGLSQCRDSDILERANFESLLESLGGESKTVQVVRFGHWGCGWIESIMVKNTAHKKLTILRESLNALEDYPVLDDSHYSALEQEAIEEDYEFYGDDWARTVAQVLGVERESLDEDELMAAVRVLHQESVAYYGQEDAFLTNECVVRMARYADSGNSIIDRLKDMGVTNE